MVELFVASRDLALEPSKGGGIGQTLCPDLALGDGKIFRQEKENDRKAESARELGPFRRGYLFCLRKRWLNSRVEVIVRGKC